jgi:hypothetical protein
MSRNLSANPFTSLTDLDFPDALTELWVPLVVSTDSEHCGILTADVWLCVINPQDGC